MGKADGRKVFHEVREAISIEATHKWLGMAR